MSPETRSARYFAQLYASPSERPVLEALFGIEREVLDSVRPGLDHHVAHSRLQWWREECKRATRGGAAHPLVRALLVALGEPQARSVPQLAGLGGFVDVATWDLASATFETRRELDAYCKRWAVAMVEPLVAGWNTHSASADSSSNGTVAPGGGTGSLGNSTGGTATADGAVAADGAITAGGTVTARSAVIPDGPAQSPTTPAALRASAQRTAAWQDLGAAICEIELIAGLASDAHHGRIRFPLDELESANVDSQSLAKLPWPETAAALIRGRLRFLRDEIQRSVAGSTREQQQALRGLLVWAGLSWRIALRLEQGLPNRPQPGRFDGFSAAWSAWRIARRAAVGRFGLG